MELSGWALLRVYKPLVTVKKGGEREVGEEEKEAESFPFKKEKTG